MALRPTATASPDCPLKMQGVASHPIATALALLRSAPHAACEYYRKAHRKSFVTVDGAFTLDVTSNSNMTEVEIEVNHPHVQPSDLTQLVTMLCQ